MNMLLSDRMNFEVDAQDIPVEIVEEAHIASQKITDPETAKALFEKLVPILETCRPNRTFSLACGMLMERQRNTSGLLSFWTDLLNVFPNDLTALRMMMRWYRRERLVEDGLAHCYRLFPNCHSDNGQATKAIVAFAELRAFPEIDSMMTDILSSGAADRSLRMRYIKALAQQTRYLDAAQIADGVHEIHKMGQGSQSLLSNVRRKAATVRKLHGGRDSDALTSLIEACPVAQWSPNQVVGNITFFTGQLGTGGAEKQLTRLAVGLQHRFEQSEGIAGFALGAAPQICVRHAEPATGGDFFLPLLKKEGVRTNLLTEMDPFPVDQINGLSAEMANLIDILPQDIAEQTCKLVPYFQRNRTRIAYLWQDGGVLAASIAALIAGVPRIITSFRGLPPSMRPNLMRPELKPLYQALFQRPEVTFSANSQCAASAYESWLSIPDGSIEVIPNAMLEISPEGSEEDQETWDRICSRSTDCTKTVLGVFRFDGNKRPELWVDVATQVARKDRSVRFVLVGSGYLLAKAQQLVKDRGMEDRIFFTGLSRRVGFFLHRCDLVMHLARMEGLPNVLIEAHLAAKPVLATPAGGTAEVVHHGKTGIVLPSAETLTTTDVASALMGTLEEPNRLQEMGEDAIEIARPRYLIDQVLERTIQLFMGGAVK